jgi:ATP-dependent RNA helicase DeaD
MQNFFSFGLPQSLLDSLQKLQFEVPTPVQAKVIPHALEGKDILGSAQTGTGKTAAFGIPLISKLLLCPHASALVIAPTRELAVQVMRMLEQLLEGNRNLIRTALLIGGEAIFKQLQQLRKNPRLVVGTPGRINDCLVRGSLSLKDSSFLVLDEADRMLDMGFTPQIDRIVNSLPSQRQTLLFSATLPKKVILLSEKYLRQPVRVALGVTTQPAANLKQEILYVSEAEKHNQLTFQLEKREGSVIVFVKTKSGAEKIAKRLQQESHSADAIHGDLSHHKRQSALIGFRNRRYRIMVATDVAARGLDIAHVKHVINYDLPQCPEDYIHRIGRTARAGEEGSSLCLITPSDKGKWIAIDRLINRNEESEPSKPYRAPVSKKRKSSYPTQSIYR